MTKKNKVVYETFPTKKFEDVSKNQDHGKHLSQYYQMYPEMCEYFMARSKIGLWSEWHEITTRYKRAEARQYEDNFVYKFINQNMIMRKFSALLMDRWWRGMKKNGHVGITYAELQDEIGLGNWMPKKDTIMGWIEKGIDQKIIGVADSQFDKRVKLYYPQEALLEFWLQRSRNEFIFYQKNGIRDLAESINARLEQDENSGLFSVDGKKVWERLRPDDLGHSVTGKKYTQKLDPKSGPNKRTQ